jgi:peroxiredoxin
MKLAAALRWSLNGGLLALGCASAPPPPSLTSPLLDDVMPSFESETLSGNSLYSASFQGQTLVVTFVDSECEPCERTLLATQSMYSDQHDVAVVAVFREDSRANASRVTRRLNTKFPVILDADGAIGKRFQLEDVPTTFVVNDMGRVSWVGGAAMTEDSLSAAVRTVK